MVQIFVGEWSEVMGWTVRKIAKNLGVSVSAVWKITNLLNCTGSVTRRPYPSNRRPDQKLTDAVKLLILHIVVNRPHLYLREIKAQFQPTQELK